MLVEIYDNGLVVHMDDKTVRRVPTDRRLGEGNVLIVLWQKGIVTATAFTCQPRQGNMPPEAAPEPS